MTRQTDLSDVEPGSNLSQVCRPLLPTAARLLPYLKSIDHSRWYTNWGGLAKALERRLSALFCLAEYGCTTTSNATDAITAALIALAGRGSTDRPYCLMPSYTFAATAAAALNAGYTPYFVDIDPMTFALSPDELLNHRVLSRAGAIIAVAPYGIAIDTLAWQHVSHLSRIPVVVDAAAGFDAFLSGPGVIARDVPVVLSFHATKVFGVGEGGAILCGDLELAKRCRHALNFGFLGARRAQITGINGKMSEYHAAVGMAELDGWPSKRAAFMKVAQCYRQAATQRKIADRIIVQCDWASSYALYVAKSTADARRATNRLRSAHLGFRYWYGDGVHREPAYAYFPADPLPLTESVAPRVVGLPVWVDLDEKTIGAVVDTIAPATLSQRS